MKGRKNVPKREFAKLDALVRELEGLKSQANALDAELMNRMETLLSLFHGAK